ncbi:MAG: hypothetical protein HQ521_06120 [Bacteroidetes bacterium]|nr:hypothetical protein [Bacteroidota bacterium]
MYYENKHEKEDEGLFWEYLQKEYPDCKVYTLFKLIKSLYPNFTEIEYKEELEREGFQNLKSRTRINYINRMDMISKNGGDGLGELRRKYEQFKNGELNLKNDIDSKTLERYKRIVKNNSKK